MLFSVGLIPENELSNNLGIRLDRVTGGPIVNEALETETDGIFACGNVLHVHDVVDYVSEESTRAGRSAAKYVRNELEKETKYLETKAGEGVGYVVPQKIRTCNLEKTLELFMRVINIYEDSTIVVKLDGNVAKKIKRKFMHPSEMQRFTIDSKLINNKNGSVLTVEISRIV